MSAPERWSCSKTPKGLFQGTIKFRPAYEYTESKLTSTTHTLVKNSNDFMLASLSPESYLWVLRRKNSLLCLPDGFDKPHWYPGCFWQPACTVYLLLDNYFLQVKCSQVFKGSSLFQKENCPSARVAEKLDCGCPARCTVPSSQYQRKRHTCQKIFVSAIQETHLSNDAYFQTNNLRPENQCPTDTRKTQTMFFK